MMRLTDKNRKLIVVAIIILAVGLFVAGYIVLPDTLAVQLSSSGEVSNTMPKLPALLIPFGLSAVFAVVYYRMSKIKYLFASLIGILIYVIELIFNLT